MMERFRIGEIVTQESSNLREPRILIVEDEMIVAIDLRASLRTLGFEVSGIERTAEEALATMDQLRPDLVLMDVRLPGEIDGISAADIICEHWQIPVVFLTAYTDGEVIARAKCVGPYGFLTKPVRNSELDATIRLALHRHELTQTLFAEQTWFTMMLGSLSDCVLATDASGHVRYLNPAASLLTGSTQDEAEGKLIEEVYSLAQPDGQPVEQCQLRKALASKAPVAKQRFYLQSQNGSLLVEDSATPIMDKGQVLGAVMVFRDITQQEKAERALWQSEKLAVVGRLAASISHEINNPLEAITNLLFLAEQETGRDSAVHAYIRQANAELARITHITTETLKFHRQSTRKTEVQVTSILESVLTLHQGRVHSLQVSVERRYKDCDPLSVFANEIRQVLANLVSNALDAMALSPERHLVLRVANATCWPAGTRGVRVTVADTGSGMSSATSRCLFQPFFTTKPATGTGLGLWVSAGLVQKHGGSIRVRSTQTDGRSGTVFAVFLPATNVAVSGLS